MLLGCVVTSAYRDVYVNDNITMNVFLFVPIGMSERVRFAIKEDSEMERTVQVTKFVE
jgi:translation elongation factor EF-Tu-like GTPase